LAPTVGESFRYLLPVLGLVAAITGSRFLRSGLPPSIVWWTAIPLASSSLGPWTAVPVLLVLCSLMISRPSRTRASWPGAAKALLWAGGAALVLLGSIGASRTLRHERSVARAEILDGAFVEVETALSDTDRVAYTSSFRGYLLFGERWERQVRYLPPGNDSTGWMRRLAAMDVDVIAVGPRHPALPRGPVDRWLEQGPFVKIAGGTIEQDVLLYRRRRGTAGEALPAIR
jgi:hypothetical protein